MDMKNKQESACNCAFSVSIIVKPRSKSFREVSDYFREVSEYIREVSAYFPWKLVSRTSKLREIWGLHGNRGFRMILTLNGFSCS